MSYAIQRAKRIIEARKAGPEAAATVEQAIALELLSLETANRDQIVRPLTYPQHGYLSPMAATEAFAQELQRALVTLASNIKVKAPKPDKYNPLVATPTLFREVWHTRQAVDELGIPYWFYVEYAVLRWYELGNKRMPRPSQLTSPDIAMHVMGLWSDPAYRIKYPLFVGWDDRFKADNYREDLAQDNALDLIVQRVADAKATGRDPASTLSEFLDTYIWEDMARECFGDDLVNEAMELQVVAIAESMGTTFAAGEANLAKVIESL
ncbi:hypothetical protein [Lysobacter terrae]